MEAPYLRLAAELRTLIATGTWPPDHRIPSSRMLQEQYGLGRGIVEHAVAQLRREGLLEGRAGARLRVAGPPTVHVLVAPDETWAHEEGERPQAGTCLAGPYLGRRLQVPETTRLHWRRVDLLHPGGKPAMLLATWRRSTVLQQHATFAAEVYAGTLSREDGALLGLPQGVTTLVVERTRFDAAGRPVETADLVLPADRWRVAL